MSNGVIDALRRVNFNWAVMLRDVWREPEGDVPQIHEALRKEFASELDALAASTREASPAGWVITGQGGSGKTHLLGHFRAECARRKMCFVLVDMTDVRDFWDTVLLGYFSSLQETTPTGRSQFQMLLDGLLKHLKSKEPIDSIVRKLLALPPQNLRAWIDKILQGLRPQFPREIGLHADVIRAVFAVASADFGVGNIGWGWLQGEAVEPDAKQLMGFTKAQEKASSIVRGLSWLMSLAGGSVVALDQLDPIITQLDLEHEALGATPALAIINKLGAGMSELRDVTQRTLVVISCVEANWRRMTRFTPKQFTDRYHPPKVLQPIASELAAESLIAQRMQQALNGTDFKPPYPTWPFKKDWVKATALDLPREVLKKAQAYLKECVARGEVKEVPPGWEAGVIVVPTVRFDELDKRFEELRSAAKPGAILDEKKEDELFGPLIRSALRCAVKEVTLPDKVAVVLDENFTGAADRKPLHARLRIVFQAENEREEHFCVRALHKTNHKSFTSRLQSAITQGGIDKALKFRRLTMIRGTRFPGGEATAKVIEDFNSFGGVWLKPTEDDLRTLEALRVMESESPDGWAEWLQTRRHASGTALVREAIPRFFDVAAKDEPSAIKHVSVVPAAPSTVGKDDIPLPTDKKVGPSDPPTGVKKDEDIARKSEPFPTDGQLLLGRQLIGEMLANKPTSIPVVALRKHAVIFAGAGSGKTVLLKRLIEEVALQGVPAIVVDCANDLAAIGDPWPSPPVEWTDGDADRAKSFFQKTERVVWTPGKESGNAMGLEPLPDLTSLASSPEELQEAIVMSVDAMTPVVAAGKQGVAKKQAILHKAFRFLAENGNCTLPGLASVLRDLPDSATAGIADERKLAAKMADDLNAQLAINPLLSSSGPVLNPAVLLGGGNGRTRISVISFIGLPTQESQQQFVNQLAMTLFTWIKKNPSPSDALRGILVIDEARDFVPSQKVTPCLGSMQRLAAQARKYGLGVVLATQNPKDIDNKIVGQCSTHWYGKMNAPAAIDAALDLLKVRGASGGTDVGALKTGRFYVSNADFLTPPSRLVTPMCLSSHAGPMEPELILEKARACRTSGTKVPS